MDEVRIISFEKKSAAFFGRRLREPQATWVPLCMPADSTGDASRSCRRPPTCPPARHSRMPTAIVHTLHALHCAAADVRLMVGCQDKHCCRCDKNTKGAD